MCCFGSCWMCGRPRLRSAAALLPVPLALRVVLCGLMCSLCGVAVLLVLPCASLLRCRAAHSLAVPSVLAACVPCRLVALLLVPCVPLHGCPTAGSLALSSPAVLLLLCSSWGQSAFNMGQRVQYPNHQIRGFRRL